MEEDVIRNNLCNYCMNKKKDCMKIEKHTRNDILTYRCVNYIKIGKDTIVYLWGL